MLNRIGLTFALTTFLACGSGNVIETQPIAEPTCSDHQKNGSEADVDCGGACGVCMNGKHCSAQKDCASGFCQGNICVGPSCTDAAQNSDETDVDCGGSCGGCAVGKKCQQTADCATSSICDTTNKRCRAAVSCAELLAAWPTSADGVYTIGPNDAASEFSAVCDMTRDGGGWTLVLKADGSGTLGYNAAYWTDDNLLSQTDLTTGQGNAKYQAFLSLPVSTLRGELDGYRFQMAISGGKTARQIFSGATNVVTPYAVPLGASTNWSVQPNCQYFGINTPYPHQKLRFGWTANNESACGTNDTAIGLGLTDVDASGYDKGAGYECVAALCSQGMTNVGGQGLLWAQ